MSNSSILGGDSAATRAAGRDTDSLGPSDSSDSGSDVQGERMMPTGSDTPDELGSMPVDLASDSDSSGTGERSAAAGDSARDGGDILPDHIVGDESVESDEVFDAGSPGDLDDIEDDLDSDDEDADDEAAVQQAVASAKADSGAADAADASSSASASHAGGGRVFRVPTGTLDESGGT